MLLDPWSWACFDLPIMLRLRRFGHIDRRSKPQYVKCIRRRTLDQSGRRRYPTLLRRALLNQPWVVGKWRPPPHSLSLSSRERWLRERGSLRVRCAYPLARSSELPTAACRPTCERGPGATCLLRWTVRFGKSLSFLGLANKIDFGFTVLFGQPVPINNLPSCHNSLLHGSDVFLVVSCVTE